MQLVQVRYLGLVPYQETWDLQTQLATQIAAGEIPPTLLLLEHPHTITFGRRGNVDNLLWSEAELQERGINVFWVDRGGDVTYHGPGQLVGYPLIPLDTSGLAGNTHQNEGAIPKADYVGYLRKLEQVLINALQTFGLPAQRIENLTGVWINRSKIAAIGVKVDVHGITRHGFALNVTPDMSYWDSIVGCGLNGYTITSMAEVLQKPPSMEQVAQAIASAFEVVFAVDCQWIT